MRCREVVCVVNDKPGLPDNVLHFINIGTSSSPIPTPLYQTIP